MCVRHCDDHHFLAENMEVDGTRGAIGRAALEATVAGPARRPVRRTISKIATRSRLLLDPEPDSGPGPHGESGGAATRTGRVLPRRPAKLIRCVSKVPADPRCPTSFHAGQFGLNDPSDRCIAAVRNVQVSVRRALNPHGIAEERVGRQPPVSRVTALAAAARHG